jgi:hypothetical protein
MRPGEKDDSMITLTRLRPRSGGDAEGNKEE